uniref:Uncharacterized protein n=1 Tax=candidate division WOR-3 bacterium TaxID=2052148 RepID=A0A7C4CCG4_UNCW3
MSRTLIAELPERAILFTNDYSIFQGVSWLLDSGTHDHSITVVSEHHLAFPWYLDRLAKSLAVPERVFELCRRLWNRAGRTNDAAFGEEAKSVTENIRYEITRSILPSRPVFWIPRDFGDWPREWRDYFLLLNGLSYRVSALPDSSVPEPLLAFPDPDMYNTTRFRDAESQDFCRRLAAAVNRRGMLRFERNFIAGALADFDLSIAYYPEYSAPIENKGLIYYFTGQPDSAAKYLRLFLRMDPQSPETSKVKTVLRSIGQLPDF